MRLILGLPVSFMETSFYFTGVRGKFFRGLSVSDLYTPQRIIVRFEMFDT